MGNIIDAINYNTQAVSPNISAPHFHSGYEFLYIAGGCAQVEINNVPHTVKAPAVIPLNPFEWHRILRADAHYRRYTLVLDPAQFERSFHTQLVTMVKCRPAGFRHVIPLDPQAQKAAESIFDTLIAEAQQAYPYRDQLIANEIGNLLILLYRCTEERQGISDKRMLQIQQYIDVNYRSIENVQSLAEHFYLSREHFCRAFKKFSGYSPVEYLLHTRLYHAQLLLLHTEKGIADICEETGFRDLNNFIRQFKKKYGDPPLAFRKKNRASSRPRV